jgi:hypothetical protein
MNVMDRSGAWDQLSFRHSAGSGKRWSKTGYEHEALGGPIRGHRRAWRSWEPNAALSRNQEGGMPISAKRHGQKQEDGLYRARQRRCNCFPTRQPDLFISLAQHVQSEHARPDCGPRLSATD